MFLNRSFLFPWEENDKLIQIIQILGIEASLDLEQVDIIKKSNDGNNIDSTLYTIENSVVEMQKNKDEAFRKGGRYKEFFSENKTTTFDKHLEEVDIIEKRLRFEMESMRNDRIVDESL